MRSAPKGFALIHEKHFILLSHTPRSVLAKEFPIRCENEHTTFHFFSLLAQQPPVGQGLLIHVVFRSRTTTQHSRQDSSGQHSKQKSMPSLVGFEPTIAAGKRPQTYALDRAAIGSGLPYCNCLFFWGGGVTTLLVVFSTAPQRALASSFARFLDHTQRHATVDRTPLDE